MMCSPGHGPDDAFNPNTVPTMYSPQHGTDDALNPNTTATVVITP
jgi:hypothetical protein